MFYRHSKWLSFAIIGFLIIITFSAYFKVIYAEFVYDDYAFIVNNKDIQSFKPFSKFFLSPNIFTGSNYAAENVGGRNWRPIASLAFALEYALFGANPYGFHLASILIHLLNIILVYFLIRKITNRSGVALVVSSLWALHPVLTEAVSWVSNQSSLIFFCFFILAVLALLKFADNYQKKYLIASYLFFGLSLLSKETALGGIFVIFFIFFIFLKKYWKLSLPFILIVLFYFYARYLILGSLGDHALRGSFFQNFLLAPAVFAKYLYLSVWPFNLLLDYANFLLPSGILDPRVVVGILSFVTLLALFFLGIKKSLNSFSFGIIWFVAFLLPVMQIIPFQDIVGERFLYAPLAGFFLFAVLSIEYLFSRIKLKFGLNLNKLTLFIIILILGAFFTLTFRRNNDWLTSENLWNSVLKIDSKNERALNNLAAYYVNANQAQKVIEFSERLLKINPENISGNLNLGAGLAMTGRSEEARSKFLYVLSKKPDYQPALVYLAVFYQNIGNYGKALDIVKNLNNKYPDREDIKQRLLHLQNIINNSNSFKANISTSDQTKYSDIEAEVQAPAVSGNIVNSGIAGRIILSNGTPFEASFDVFKADDMSTPFISVRSNAQGNFQIPLRPAIYVIKPNNPERSYVPIKNQYTVTVGNGRWLQIKIEYAVSE